MFLVIQQGGLSTELYASVYDTQEEAEEAKRGHQEATYNATDPIEVPSALAAAICDKPEAECALAELIDEAAAACVRMVQ